MSTITLSSEIDAEEALELCSTTDVCREVLRRLQTTKERQKLTADQKHDLREVIVELMDEFKLTPPKPKLPPIITLDDQLKLEHIEEVWTKYSSDQVIKALPL